MSIKQAIEALENVRHHISSASIYFANGEAEQGQKILGDAIRMVMETEAALAALRSMPEPVAWGMRLKMTGEIYDCITPGEHEDNPGEYTVPLYAPPHTAPVLSDAWQPISTAPKDGRTLLLGYFNSHGKWRTMRGRWYSLDTIVEEWEESDLAGEGWYETVVESDDYPNCWWAEPTHWMHLPPPPAAALAGDTGEAAK